MDRNEELKEGIEAGKTMQNPLIQLAEDYLAISDSGLLPKEKKQSKYLNPFNEEIPIDDTVISFNSAIHECRLRMIKNMMTIKEITTEIFCSGGYIKIANGSNYPWLDEIKQIATTIFEAMDKKIRVEKKMKGEK